MHVRCVLCGVDAAPLGNNFDQMLDAFRVLGEHNMLVRFVCLRDSARPEDDRRNPTLIDEVPHVATEGRVGDLAVAAAPGEQIRGLDGNWNLTVLAGAVVDRKSVV